MRLSCTLSLVFLLLAACSDPTCQPGELRVGTMCRSVESDRPDGSQEEHDEELDGSAAGEVAVQNDAATSDGSAWPDGSVAEADELDNLPGGPPAFQFRADGVTLDGAGIAAISNRRGSDSLVLRAGTLAASVSDPGFGGAPSLVFDGTQWLLSDLPPSRWKFLHDGTGYEAFHVFAPTSSDAVNVIGGTLAAGPGTFWPWGPNDVARQQVNNATPAAVVVANAGGAPTLNAATYVDAFYGETSVEKYGLFLKDTLVISGSATSDKPTFAESPDTFALGAGPAGAAPAHMRWCETLVFDRVLTAPERVRIRRYIERRYFPHDFAVQELQPRAWFRADGAQRSGDNVTALPNKAYDSFDRLIVTGTLTLTSAHAGLGNQPALAFTGKQWADSDRPLADWQFLVDGTGFDMFTVLKNNSPSTRVLHAFPDGNAARMQVTIGSQSFGDVGVLINNNKPASVLNLAGTGTSSGRGTIALEVAYGSKASPQAELRVNGMSVAQGSEENVAPAASTSATGTYRLGALGNKGIPVEADLADVLIFNRVLSAAERTKIQTYIQARYGL